MSFFDALHTSASGLSAQRMRMNLITSNLANVDTLRTAEGGPYRRKEPVFAAENPGPDFARALDDRLHPPAGRVTVVEVVEDPRPPVLKYKPGHPEADENGYVAMPNINLMEEMANMMSASRSYEANVTAISTTKKMALKALEIGR